MIFPRYDREDELYTEEKKASCPRTLFRCQGTMGTIAGYKYDAAVSNGKTVVIVPGKGAGADDYLSETAVFLEHGYTVIAYDGSGCYGSEGEDSGGFSQGEKDLRVILSAVHEQFGIEDVFLFGHSLGGFASVRVLDGDGEALPVTVKAAVLASSCNSVPLLMLETATETVGDFLAIGYPVIYGYEILKNGWDCVTTDAAETVENCGIPILILQGSEDTVCSAEGSSLYAYRSEIASDFVELELLDNAGENGHTTILHDETGVNEETMKRILDFFENVKV